MKHKESKGNGIQSIYTAQTNAHFSCLCKPALLILQQYNLCTSPLREKKSSYGNQSYSMIRPIYLDNPPGAW
uniref:Uncharacterized protein n=1 Tax=Zea mays TaxID=4577 RepID=C4J1W9_MAIZE|nr:unknown [Zea mays]ACR37073.1 unknown [Zea mays]